MADQHDNHDSDFLRSALAALVEVMLVSLALGMAVGFGVTPLAMVLTAALAGTAAISVVLLRHKASRGHDLRESVANQSLADEPLTDEPLVDELTEVAETLDEPKSASTLQGTDDELATTPTAQPLETELTTSPSVDLAAFAPDELPPSTLDLEALSARIVGNLDPIAELKLFVGDIRTREAEGTYPPSSFERFAARLLCEAGLFKDDVELPVLRIVRPSASGMFYLRIHTPKIPYLAKVRVFAIEAALNALRFSDTYFENPDEPTVEEHYQLIQKLTHSVTAQSPNLSEHVPVIEDESPDTEWAVRLGISTAIESFQLPHRLTATWRVDVADGNVGIEIDLTPEAVFPATRYVDGLGLVATSREMRRKAASDYALRLALLVASAAFRCSERITHVWVAGILETATRRSCYLSVDFDRWRFARLDLAELEDLREIYHTFAAVMRYEDGILRPVEQGFSLEDKRFCPPRRYEPVSLSRRKIAHPFSDELGAERVSGLSIDEGGNRELMAADILAHLGDTTEQNVRLIMRLAGDDPDPTVRSAAERTVTKLIDGSIGEDGESIVREFMSGDALSRAVQRAGDLFAHHDPTSAEELLVEVLGPIDEAGIYTDSAYIEHRFFPNYVERALYNHLFALKDHAPLLVPGAYFHAHFLLSLTQLVQGKVEEATRHAQRLVELAPLDARCRLHLTRCLEMMGDSEGAIATLKDLLRIAHDPEGLAMAYYRMAYFQWEAGHPLAAQACYALALRFLPQLAPIIAMEMATLAMHSPGAFHEGLDEEEAVEILRDRDIPVAPTEEMSDAFLRCARAALDAEIFPVARNFVGIMGILAGDDILYGLIRSIEDGQETWPISPELPGLPGLLR